MRSFVQKTSLMLVLLFLFTLVLTGCGSSNSNKTTEPSTTVASSTESSQPAPQLDPYQAEIAKGEAKLILYLIGDQPVDQLKVVDEINKLIKKDINATMEVKNIPWANWDQKYQLIFNSGEEFDAAFTAGWTQFQQLATKGAFYEITEEVFKNYMPNTYPSLTNSDHKFLWDNSTINGKHYIISQTYDWQNPYVALVRGDLREKYKIPEIKTYDDILNYTITIGNKEKGIIPINALGTDDKIRNEFINLNQWSVQGTFFIATDYKADDGKLFNTLEKPEFIEWAKKMKEVQKANGFSKSVLSSKTDAEAAFKAGTSAVDINGFAGPLGVYMEIVKTHPEWKPEIFDIQGDFKLTGSKPFDAGLAVHATSKNPERALMMLDLLRSKKEYNDLLNLGIPGTHWESVGDDKYKQSDAGAKNYAAYANCPWGGNTDLMRVDASFPDWVKQMRDKWKGLVYHPKLELFTIDDTNVKSELAAIKNLEAAVLPAIQFGLVDDPAKAIADLDTKVKAAGLDKVMAEFQAQADKFLANNQ